MGWVERVARTLQKTRNVDNNFGLILKCILN
jgi:hypothetical protein